MGAVFGVGTVIEIYALVQQLVDWGMLPAIGGSRPVPTSALWVIGALMILIAPLKAYITKARAFEESESSHDWLELEARFEAEFLIAREAFRTAEPMLRKAAENYTECPVWKDNIFGDPLDSGSPIGAFARMLFRGWLSGQEYDDEKQFESEMSKVGAFFENLASYKRWHSDFYANHIEERRNVSRTWRVVAILTAAVQKAQRDRDYPESEAAALPLTAAMECAVDWGLYVAGPGEDPDPDPDGP